MHSVCYSLVCPHCVMKVPPSPVPCPPTLCSALSSSFSFYRHRTLSLLLLCIPCISLTSSPYLRPCVYFYPRPSVSISVLRHASFHGYSPLELSRQLLQSLFSVSRSAFHLVTSRCFCCTMLDMKILLILVNFIDLVRQLSIQ